MTSNNSTSKTSGRYDAIQLGLLIVSIVISRLPFLDLGFGRLDAWRVGVTGKVWSLTGDYLPSRPPGFPLPELVAKVSYGFFGDSPSTWIATNCVTLLIFCISTAALWVLMKKWEVPSYRLAAWLYAFAPLNYVYSTETIDYTWTAAFIILAILAWEYGSRSSPVYTGLLLGIASACRFSAAFILVPLVYLEWKRNRSIKNLIAMFLTFAFTGAAFYAVTLLSPAGFTNPADWVRELNRVTAARAELAGNPVLRRLLMPATGLFGPLATISLLAAGIFGFKKFAGYIKKPDGAVITSTLVSIFIIVPYIWHLHPNYLIPVTAFLFIIVAKTVSRKFLVIAGLLILLANIPAWQAKVEGMGIIRPEWSRAVAGWQNESIFNEILVRQELYGDAAGLLSKDLDDNVVLMAGTRLPLIQFLYPGCRPVTINLYDGDVIGVWGAPDSGIAFKYMISPAQAEALNKSGYRTLYVPGMEVTYLATYGTSIDNVPELVSIYNQD